MVLLGGMRRTFSPSGMEFQHGSASKPGSHKEPASASGVLAWSQAGDRRQGDMIVPSGFLFVFFRF